MIIRHTAATITVSVALLLSVPRLLNIPKRLGLAVYKHFTYNASSNQTTVEAHDLLTPWPDTSP